jgi:hypothetical protein
MTEPSTDDALSLIQNEVDLVYERLRRYPWAEPKLYAAWLSQTYFYVRQVSRVLAAAAVRTPLDEPEFHEHFLRAITEEKDHGIMALNDLRELGFEIEQFREQPLTKAFYQTLFFSIDTQGFPALLGYFFVLEGVAGARGTEIYRVLKEAYAGRAISFVEEHVILDAEHYPRSLAMLRGLRPDYLRVVLDSTQLAGPIYRHMIDAVEAEYRGPSGEANRRPA